MVDTKTFRNYNWHDHLRILVDLNLIITVGKELSNFQFLLAIKIKKIISEVLPLNFTFEAN